MRRSLAALDRFWFPVLPPSHLAFLRIAIGGYALGYLVESFESLRRSARTAPEFFAPVGLASLFEARLDPRTFDLLLVAAVLSGLLFVLGLAHRLTGPLFATLLLAVLSYRNSWSMIFHSDNLLVLHVAILGLAPSAAALSLDARRAGSRPAPDGAFGWPVRLICSVTCLAYFLAGVAKVAGPLGWSWATGEALHGQIAIDALRKDLLGDGVSQGFLLLQDQLWLLTLLAVSTLVIELGAPLVLFSRRAGALWALAAFGMHWGILLLMGVTFRYQLAGFAFVPFLAALGARPAGARAAVERPGTAARALDPAPAG